MWEALGEAARNQGWPNIQGSAVRPGQSQLGAEPGTLKNKEKDAEKPHRARANHRLTVPGLAGAAECWLTDLPCLCLGQAGTPGRGEAWHGKGACGGSVRQEPRDEAGMWPSSPWDFSCV